MTKKIIKSLMPVFMFSTWVSGILLLSHTFPTNTEEQTAGIVMLNIVWLVCCVVSGMLIYIELDKEY